MTPTRLIDVVTLRMGGEMMALPASIVRKILEPVPISRVPLADDFSGGLINVRGTIVPLADLKVAFGMSTTAETQDTRFLVLDIKVENEEITAGVVADKVHDVIAIDEALIENIPSMGMAWAPELVRGVVKWQGAFMFLPNLETVFSQAIARCASAGSY